jgi:probable phosphoglycerate mutase
MRHAHVSYAGDADPEDVQLTLLGREQAEAARRALEGLEFDLVVASSLPRTRETAAIVAPGHEIEPWPEFDEWRGGPPGSVDLENLEQLFVGALHIQHEDQQFLGGESLGEVLDRVLPAFDELIARDWHTALLVLHGGVNRIVLSQALAGGRAYFGRFEQAPACINVLDLDGSGWVVRTVNYIPYDPLHPSRTTTMEDVWAEIVAAHEGA